MYRKHNQTLRQNYRGTTNHMLSAKINNHYIEPYYRLKRKEYFKIINSPTSCIDNTNNLKDCYYHYYYLS